MLGDHIPANQTVWPVAAGQNYDGFNSALLLLLSAMRNSSGMSGDREQVRRGNRMVARPGRSEEIRTQEVSQQKQQAIRGKDRASPYGRMFAGHFCSLWVEPFMAIASFLSSPFVYIQHNSIRLSFTPHTHSATCVKRQAPLGASACCLCVFPSETTLCWTLDWQEVAVHSGS